MAEVNTQGQTGRRARRNKLHRRADVWKHYFPSVNDAMAQCKHCGSRLNQTYGTTSLRKHLVNEFTTWIDKQGDKKGVLRCKICQGEFAASDGWDHVKGCIEVQDAAADEEASSRPPPPVQTGAELQGVAAVGASELPPPEQTRAPLGSGPSSMDCEPVRLRKAEAGMHLARMIALGGYDSSVVEDKHFRSFVGCLDPGFELPSRGEVEDMCDGICDEEMEVFLSRIRDSKAGFSFSVGTAETTEVGRVAYLACHFIDDQWNLHRIVTDARVIKPDYRGPLLGARVSREFDVLSLLKDFAGRMNHERHEEYVMLWKTVRRYIDKQVMIPYDEFPHVTITKFACVDCMDESVHQVFHDIARILNLYNVFFDAFEKVHSLCLTRKRREKLLSDCRLENPRAHDESWYAGYCSLAVLYSVNSSAFARTETDSGLIYNLETGTFLDSAYQQLLFSIWDAIYRAIESLSATRIPTSNLYLVELFNVRHVLDSKSPAPVYLLNTLTEAKNTLDTAIKDSYLLWSTPLILDPRYKLKYLESNFETAFGSEVAANMVSEVTKRIQDLYERYLKKHPGSGRDEMNVDSNDNPSRDDSQEAGNELNRYLQDPRARPRDDFDILKWWKEYGSDMYPMVAGMARDALTTPTCSKLSSEQTAQLRSIVCGYSKKAYTHYNKSAEDESLADESEEDESAEDESLADESAEDE